MSINTETETQPKVKTIRQRLLVAFLHCAKFIIFYFLFQKDFYLLSLVLINDLYNEIFVFFIEKKTINIDHHNYNKLNPIILQGASFHTVFLIILSVLFVTRAIQSSVHILIIILVMFYCIALIVFNILSIKSTLTSMNDRLKHPDLNILNKKDILSVIKKNKSSMTNHHGVIILTKVLPEDMNQQQKEELDEFFMYALNKTTLFNFSGTIPFVGQYSENQFIICYNNIKTPYWETFFKNFDSKLNDKSDESLAKLTTFNHDALKESQDPIVKYTYTSAYYFPEAQKHVSLKQLYEKASSGTTTD